MGGASAEPWFALAADAPGAAGLASSPLTAAAFFTLWVALGAAVALGLVRRGHDRATMLAVGAGLGPLMLVVAADSFGRTHRTTGPLVVDPGTRFGGDLHVLVVVVGHAQGVRALSPTLEAVRASVATVTVAQVVTYESIEAGRDDGTVAGRWPTLRAARDLLPFEGAGIELHPGTMEAVAGRFRRRFPRTLVLFAPDELLPAESSPGPG